MPTEKRKRILSGITPSGDGSLHIGNYLGAVRQFVALANTYETFLMVADLHALTTIQDKETLKRNTEALILNELALLGDIPNLVFFRQSDVPSHTELQSVLNNVTPLGLLKRAHAYKDKLQKDVMEDDINVGLFSYPMLMAADILMYNADLVPVGKDQKQHIEITRDIAGRFNRTFGKTVFTLPEPFIQEDVAVILGTDGKRKMSKSLGNIISIFEPEEVLRKQVMSIYTDPTRIHANDPGHVEGNMVFAYLDHFDPGGSTQSLKEQYMSGSVSDVEVKEYLFAVLMRVFGPARDRYADLKAHPVRVRAILEDGAARANLVARDTMAKVNDAVGLKNHYSVSRVPYIPIDDFAKVEIRAGKVLDARNKEGSEKLIRLTVDIGETHPRVIFTGVRGYGYTPEDFSGKQFFFITNLAYRKMLDEESQGMILAADGAELPFGEHADAKPVFIAADGLPVGAKIR